MIKNIFFVTNGFNIKSGINVENENSSKILQFYTIF